MASSSSQAVTVTTVDLKKYDVFISFRGDDTRAGFTSHLHAALNRKYLETYIDYRIEKGNQVWVELEKAIQDSTLFLVVFSENYANSTWCLNELVEIMECHKNGQVVVIPVFYQIDPSDVRKQTGSYGTALAKHKKQAGNNNNMMMQNWKNSLSQAANLSGYHSATYGTESDLIEDIITAVLRKLNDMNTNDHTCNLILDENYWGIRALIKFDSTEVQIIGLWGMGGIGKTTLAAAVFDKISFQYEGSCFLENVTEESKKHGINYMCNILLSKLLREDLHIDTSKAIPSMIIRRLKRMKSLIVLDDVHTLELLQNFIGVRSGWLGTGSTVIVTTRDKHVLISAGIQKFHQVDKMNSETSLKLFSMNAFDQVLPGEGYVELSKRTIAYADGNPLALKVLGSFLRCKSEIEWNCALLKLKEIPNAEIDSILRWSYNELDDTEKNIFLDIVCFFKGDTQVRVTNMLNKCGFFADIGIKHLIDKALIRVDFKKCIQMQDLIQEMGKQIVREESLKNPGQRSRLFNPKEICDVLKNNRGSEMVEVISLDADEHININLSPKAFKKMKNLRLLAIRDHIETKYVSLPHGLDILPENLKYFMWNGYPLKSLPPCPSTLVELCLEDSNVEKLWNGVLNLPNLETLDLTGSKKLIKCPNVSGSPNLKRVFLFDCESMTEVDPSIFLLQKLDSLLMNRCTSLKSLSSDTCSPAIHCLHTTGCINLQEFSVTFTSVDNLTLDISNWDGNELPSSLLHIKNLDTFFFPIVECLVDLPKNFAHCIWLRHLVNHDPSITLHKVFSSPAFITLEILFLSSVMPSTLSKLPDNISLLSSLQSLTLLGLGISSLPDTIICLPQLRRLVILHCHMLLFIPVLSNFIPFVYVSDCQSIERVLSSMVEPYKSKPITFVLLNLENLDTFTVLKEAMIEIHLRANPHSANEIDDTIQYMLPAMPSIDHWFDYTSTRVAFTLNLPPNLLGFAYYLVLSPGRVGKGACFGCDCYLDNISGERIRITSFSEINFPQIILTLPDLREPIHMELDHVVLWYDPVTCKQIMEIVDHVNSTSHNPKLTFRFFIDESEPVYDEVSIKKCGFRGIYKEAFSPTIFESLVEDGNTVSTEKLETILEDAISKIERGARLNSGNEYLNMQYLLPVMAAMEYWFDYTSTQVSFILELPPNLLGFAYYFVLSKGRVRKGACSGCECGLDNVSGERIFITSFPAHDLFGFPDINETSIPIGSDHVVFWYDPVACKQITEAVDDHVNITSYSPKLTFRFFFDETETVSIKECGFHWIYKKDTVSTIFESHDEAKLKAEEKLLGERSLMETLKPVGLSQTTSQTKQLVEECSPKVIVNGSVKGSCSTAPANIKEDSNSDSDSVQKVLCMIVKSKDYFPIQLEHDACVTNFMLSPKCMKELLVGDNWLDFSILQLWCTYMHRLSIKTNNSDLYAFLDPCLLNFTSEALGVQKTVKQYIQTKLRDLKKECYLAPYLWSGHWQLIIMCPKDNIIVCLCSLLRKEINATMKDIVTNAFMVHQAACDNRKKPTWIFPKTRVQPNGIDCGYYVMKNMIDIVSASVTKGWMEVFNDPTTLTEEELYDLRNHWATCFIDLYNPEDRGVHGYRSIRESANQIQPNQLFTRTRSFAARTLPNPPNPQIIGSDIGFELLNPSTRESNPFVECTFEMSCCTVLYTLLLLILCNLLLKLI